MINICKRFHFDAAHHLPYYEGNCHNIHGHRWHIDVEISGPIRRMGTKTGMIIDFGDLKRIVNQAVILKVDHTDLNTKFENPTAELMVDAFAIWIQEALFEYFKDNIIKVVRIRLYETEDAYAEWRRE